MKFEVNQFLVLTALLATAAATVVGCSSTDGDKVPGGNAGSGGDSGAVGADAGTGAVAHEGGAAGALGEAGQGGSSEGGASEGGAAGAGTGMCIGDLVGQGGAADEGSTPCDGLVGAAGAADCGDESGLSYAAQGCFKLYNSGVYRPSVIDAYNTCAAKLPDSCDGDAVIGCADALVGNGCGQDTTAEACALVASYCPAIKECSSVMNLLTLEGQAAVADCMDPSSENYVALTEDDCDVNLKFCANLPVPAQLIP